MQRESGAAVLTTSRLALLNGAVLVDMIGLGIILPLLPFYAESMGATPVQVTLLVASFSAMQLAAAPVWGRVSDRRGRRPLLVVSLFASALSHLLFGLAGSLPVLFASRLTAGAAGGTITLAQAYVADTTVSKERTRAMGWIGAVAGLGIMLGPAVGGFFSRFGLGAPGFVAAGLCAVNGLLALAFLPESRSRPPGGGVAAETAAATLGGWVRAMTREPLSRLLCIYFLSISSFTGMLATLALFLERTFGIGAEEMGFVMALGGGVTVLVRGVLLGPLVQRLGEERTVRFGAAALALSLLSIPLLPALTWVVVPVSLYAIGAGTLFPSLASLVSSTTDSGSTGAILGGSQVVGGLGRVLGPLGAGALFQYLGISAPFLTGATLVACAWLIALPLRARVDDVDPTPSPISSPDSA